MIRWREMTETDRLIVVAIAALAVIGPLVDDLAVTAQAAVLSLIWQKLKELER